MKYRPVKHSVRSAVQQLPESIHPMVRNLPLHRLRSLLHSLRSLLMSRTQDRSLQQEMGIRSLCREMGIRSLQRRIVIRSRRFRDMHLSLPVGNPEENGFCSLITDAMFRRHLRMARLFRIPHHLSRHLDFRQYLIMTPMRAFSLSGLQHRRTRREEKGQRRVRRQDSSLPVQRVALL